MKTKSIFLIGLLLYDISANAQIVYTDIIPDIFFSSSGTYDLDLNNDATFDYRFIYTTSAGCYTSCPLTMDSYSLSLNVFNSNEVADSSSSPYKLYMSDSIDSVHLLWSSAATQLLGGYGFYCDVMPPPHCNGTPHGNWSTANNNYLGLKLYSNGNIYFGWVRLNITYWDMTIYDYAYNSVPNQPIQAGDLGNGWAFVNDIKNDFSISLSPNPATNQLTINNAQLKIKSADIYDVVGKKVLSMQPKTSSVDVSTLRAGIYFVKVKTEKGVSAGKFVKQ